MLIYKKSISFLKRRVRKFKFTKEYLLLPRKSLDEIKDLDLDEIYNYLILYFHKYLSKDLKRHRGYFFSEFRGFGEDAFHCLWYLLFKEFRPRNVLEIGIYRGQTLSLFQILSNKLNLDSFISGISPLDSTGDEFSEYLDIDYEKDILRNFEFFGLGSPNIFKTHSASAEGINHINSKSWDLIYIDGSHKYEDVLSDLRHSLQNLSKKGIIILDDSSLYTNYSSEKIEHKYKIKSTKGHEGPSLALNEILKNNLNLKILITVGHMNVIGFK